MQMTCPDEESLIDYFENRLSGGKREEMERHLADCDLCLSQLAVLNGLSNAPDRFELDAVPESVTTAAVKMVSELSIASHSPFMIRLKRAIKHVGTKVSDSLGVPSWFGWRFAPVRGSKVAVSEELVCLKVSFGRINTDIEIEKIKEEMAHIRIKLSKPSKTPVVIRVTLKKGDREIASYLLEDYVLFEYIPFDHYNISLFLYGENMGTYFFEIKENRYGGK